MPTPLPAHTGHGLPSGPSEGGGQGRLAAAFVLALALHAAGLVGIAYLRLTPPSPPGDQEITIDLAPQMMEAET
ncbi:hypothetical protein AAHH80_34020, partial [Burkholderia pseudomallei]